MATAPITLLSNASSTGSWVAVQPNGEYVFSCVGTFGGATVQLQLRGPDGSTAIDIPSGSLTANGAFVVSFGGDSQARVSVSGGTPSGLYATLDKAI